MAASAQPSPTVTGTVLEAFDSGGYTYLRLRTAEGETWAAVNPSKVAKGANVAIANALPMHDFESKSLRRRFETIVFGTLAEPVSGGAPNKPAETTGDMGAFHGQVPSPPADLGTIEVTRAEGSEGRTVAEVFAQRAELNDKPVAVRGKVVKFLPGIMGRNWIHLRDGTGSHDGKNDDLTITTKDTVGVGELVLVKGIVRSDRDFGAGYVYPVLIEEAALSR